MRVNYDDLLKTVAALTTGEDDEVAKFDNCLAEHGLNLGQDVEGKWHVVRSMWG